jgi:hypothetical protein
MFGIGMTELMVIFVIGLLVLGPKRLPELARSRRRSNRPRFPAISRDLAWGCRAAKRPHRPPRLSARR